MQSGLNQHYELWCCSVAPIKQNQYNVSKFKTCFNINKGVKRVPLKLQPALLHLSQKNQCLCPFGTGVKQEGFNQQIDIFLHRIVLVSLHLEIKRVAV